MSIPDRYLRSPRCIPGEASLRAAAREMKEHGVGCLLVVDGSGRPAGVITDRDIALHVLRHELDPDRTEVNECASRPVVSLERGASLLQAAQRMHAHAIRRLPVVDEEGVAVGWVSADDLVAELAQELRLLGETTQEGFAREKVPAAGTGSVVFGKE